MKICPNCGEDTYDEDSGCINCGLDDPDWDDEFYAEDGEDFPQAGDPVIDFGEM